MELDARDEQPRKNSAREEERTVVLESSDEDPQFVRPSVFWATDNRLDRQNGPLHHQQQATAARPCFSDADRYS
jgi:hypothetical protein